MFPFWESVVAPIINASGGRRIVEIGALRGENTVKMLEDLGADTELHVIDPLPAFDPAEHEAQFPGRYVFHRGLSLEVLPNCPPFDVALIDGDHNWYTVYNECKQLAQVARAGGARTPIMILHDVCWPYGRRDLYYAPEQIPAEFRQPYQHKGMRPGRRALLPGGGMNKQMANAEMEGGPRNGVRTGYEDWVEEYDLDLKVVVIPIYFGLAIIIEQALLDENAELAEVMRALESGRGQRSLLELGEKTRLEAVIFDQNFFDLKDRTIDHAFNRYLDLLKGSLLNEHYLENELRIKYLLDTVVGKRGIDTRSLRDPVRHMKNLWRRLKLARNMGQVADGQGPTAFFPYTDIGRTRLDQIEQAMDVVYAEGIPGDVADISTGRGGVGIFLRGYLDIHKLDVNRIHDRTVWVVDEFRAADGEAAPQPIDDGDVTDLLPDVNQVRDGFEHFGLLDERVRFVQGEIAHSLVDAPIEQLALVRIGRGLGAEVGDVLSRLYDRIAVGGFVIIEDYVDPEVAAAVDAFRSATAVTAPLEQVDWSGVTWRRSETDGSAIAPPSTAPLNRIPLVEPTADPIDLSVIVVFYNMKREAARTLRSLTRDYQIDVDGLDYEVIVVENGSEPGQALGADYVEGFGPEFHYLDMGEEATPSPTVALNAGLARSRGRHVALMIDGAHVLTPGVLRHGVSGLTTYRPAIVATQQWYVGPGQQGDAMNHGYDQTVEDELFDKIAWPVDGYRLFEIGHFIGERDWFDGMQESNCIFVDRELLEQIGGFDESFSMPGAGYANLDFWERLAESPGVKMASILGEGSFHQFHGGTTTNLHDDEERRRRVFSYGSHYKDTRGRTFHGPGKPFHYVGGLQVIASRRTRARRMSTEMFSPTPAHTGPDGLPDKAIAIPDELRNAFVEAYWHNLAWRQSVWMGRKVRKAPTDLIAYQELIYKVRPDVIIETGTGNGGRALFLASICDLLDHGQVITIGRNPADDIDHPRVTVVTGAAHTPDAVAQVRAITGPDPKGLVVLGTRGRKQQMMAEFEAYAPFVPVDSYIVMEETVVNGRPVWPGFGAGPAEALNHLLVTHGEFIVDRSMEKYALTLNPGGYLKRVK